MSKDYDYPCGQIINLKDFGFKYSINNDKIDSGSPIVLLENQRVIGIYDNKYNDNKFGIFFGEIIKELKKDEEKKINLIKEVEEEDLKEDQKEESVLKIKQNNENSQLNPSQKNDLDNLISIKYLINNKKNIKIFGANFIENNKNLCKIIINNEEKELCEYIDIQNIINLENPNVLEIKLKPFKPFQNISYMFSGCK